MQRLKHSIVIFFLMGLVGCASQNMAPVVSARAQPKQKTGVYQVKQGDTLYSIAWSYDIDYRKLAKANHLKPPYAIRVGEQIRISIATKTPSSVTHRVVRRPNRYRSYALHWMWPARGRIVKGFSSNRLGNKGLDIKGRLGEAVVAAAAGQVVYCGAGLRGYGNLIIIKHNNSFLSAYAFNKRMLVKLGERVRRGQKIALMGRNNSGEVRLYFEIRRNGTPVDPEYYLMSTTHASVK